MRNCPPLVDILKRLECQIEASLLFRQPLGQGLTHDPALAAVNAFGDLVHTRNEIVRKLGSDHTSIVSHLTHLSKKIKTNNIQYGPIIYHQQDRSDSVTNCR